MSPQPRLRLGCGDIWESVVSQPWPQTQYQFLQQILLANELSLLCLLNSLRELPSGSYMTNNVFNLLFAKNKLTVKHLSRTLVGNRIVDHSCAVKASPVGAAPNISHLRCVLYKRFDLIFYFVLGLKWRRKFGSILVDRGKPFTCYCQQ